MQTTRMSNGMPLSSRPSGINDLYAIAERNACQVDAFPISRPSLSIEHAGKCYIAIRPDVRGTLETESIAHELGHCVFGGFYNRYSPFDRIQRAERRADKWAYYHLLPPSWLHECFRRMMPLCDIADEAGVSEEYAAHAIEYYRMVGVL